MSAKKKKKKTKLPQLFIVKSHWGWQVHTTIDTIQVGSQVYEAKLSKIGKIKKVLK